MTLAFEFGGTELENGKPSFNSLFHPTQLTGRVVIDNLSTLL